LIAPPGALKLDIMRILAIDTALAATSVCVFDSAAGEILARESEPMERGHAEALAPMLERVVGAVEGGFASLDRIAVTVGPGSFTGIRIGLAAAHGVAIACGIEVVGVSTLAALAAPHIFDSFEGALAATIDARHGHVYVAAFGPDGRMLLAPRRAGAHEALRAIGDGPLNLVGGGAELLMKEARASGVAAKILSLAAAPDIAVVARLGLAADAATAPARPLYLKAADAKTIAERQAAERQTAAAAAAPSA
jgi:tRNA threonylcarbamoyladenosine biosynthesis protein TsaB